MEFEIFREISDRVGGGDTVQDMLPPITALWPIKYFKQKESETWHVKEGPSNLPLKQVIKHSFGRYNLSLYLEERHIFTAKTEQHQEESE